MPMYRVVSCVVGRGVLAWHILAAGHNTLWPVCYLGKTVSLYPASFCTPRPNLPVIPGSLDLLLLLIHGPNIPGSYAILFFTALDFTFATIHIHNWSLFLLWLSIFIPSGAMSLLFSGSILGTYWPGEVIFQCYTFGLFIQFMRFSRQEFWSSFHTLHQLMDHVLPDLKLWILWYHQTTSPLHGKI